MNKLFKAMTAVMLAAATAFGASAQQLPKLPADSAVVVGKLPNGLTYYIRHNEYPKGQADFHIAQKVGSVLEEDNQRGLAHFLEHMCFNGTKNFPGNSLVSYLESIGVKFGNHLNAYTGTDETVYKITNVPTARTQVTDSVLLILHDWANELLLDPGEIDKERAVIHEEWRTSNKGQMRILEQLLPRIYPGSRYGHRLPIGTMEVVDNFPHQALRDYYEAWYRPDLQGIVVCGDIDVERTERVVKEMFGDIEMPADAPARVKYPVPDTPGTIFAIGADKEQPNNVVYLMFKHESIPDYLRNTPAYLAYDYITDMIDIMLNARFQEMMSKPDTPFAFAQAEIGNYMLSSTEEMFAVIAAAKDGNLPEALAAIYREVLRARRGGFTQSEYDRAKAEYLAALENRYNNRNSVENAVYTNAMIRSFIDGIPMMSITDEYEIMSRLPEAMGLKEINETFSSMVSDDNRVVLCMQNDAYPLPSEATLRDMMQSVDAEEIEVFTDNTRTDPLIPVAPAPGSITATAPLAGFAATETWTLSNGARVILKKTDFKSDEIIFAATSPVGLSTLYGTVKPADARAMDVFATTFGLGSYNSNDLQKLLAGKQVSFNPAFDIYDAGLSGRTTPRDLPVLMELIYAYFTSVNYPKDEFEATRNIYYGLLQNQESNPEYIFRRDMAEALYSSPYRRQLSAQDVKDASRAEIESIAKAMVRDASKWTFTFVGNIEPETLRLLACKYLASLPGSGVPGVRVTAADPSLEVRKGSGTDTFTAPMENPQTYCMILESATVPYTSLNAKLAGIAGQILDIRLTKTIREEMGAVYSISAYGNLSAPLGLNASISTGFPMNPEMKQSVTEAIKAEIISMGENGVTAEELSKVKEYMVKNYTERAEQNGAWASYISQWTLSGVNLFSGAIEQVNSITAADVQNFVKEMNAQGNYRVVILDPEKK